MDHLEMPKTVYLSSLCLLTAIVVSGPEASAGDQRVRVGDHFPAFSLPHMSSKKTFDSKSLSGKVVVIDFWGSDCPPCREAVPKLNELSDEFRGKVTFLGINVDENENDTKAFLEEFKPRYLLLDDGKHRFVPKLGIEAMPTTYLVDRESKIRFINTGFRTSDKAKIRSAILEALKK